jgi:hypothetical protein
VVEDDDEGLPCASAGDRLLKRDLVEVGRARSRKSRSEKTRSGTALTNGTTRRFGSRWVRAVSAGEAAGLTHRPGRERPFWGRPWTRRRPC